MAADDTAVLDAYPHAAIDHDNLEFYRGLLDRRFLVNRCAECGHWHVPPRPICPSCWSSAVTPTEISGGGVVQMFVVVHQGAPPAGEGTMPFPIVTVELAEQHGLRISTMLTDCARGDLRIDLAVELAWLERGGAPYPVFRPVSDPRSGA